MNVTTHHNDDARTGANLRETALNVLNVRGNFGRLFERKVEGAVYAQPLYVEGVKVSGGGASNVLFVATMRNFVYAFDADKPWANAPLWGPISLGPPIALPDPDISKDYHDIEWEIGVVGTPVIDLGRNALYVVAATKENCVFKHKLHRLDLSSGALTSSPPIAAFLPALTGLTSAMYVTFRSDRHNQRPGLALAADRSRIYAGFASYGDIPPYHGWILAFDADTLVQREVFCSTPVGDIGEGSEFPEARGGIWMAGEAPAIDSDGNLFLRRAMARSMATP